MARRNLNIGKTTIFAIAINALQILAALTVAVLSIVIGDRAFSGQVEQIALSGMALVVVWGAALDIRDAFAARRLNHQSNMLEDALLQLNNLNTTLRAQRHDFKNHLQVVFGLVDMGACEEARAYIERVYGDIQRVGRAMKTSIPAVNALMAAKMTECESRNVRADLETASSWKEMPVTDWELCRVFGNLIDNALDALEKTQDAKILITIGETLRDFTFSVENNGPAIDPDAAEHLFEPGFGSHGEGRGMGLAIVKEIMESYDGRIEVVSDASTTRFSGCVPKPGIMAQA